MTEQTTGSQASAPTVATQPAAGSPAPQAAPTAASPEAEQTRVVPPAGPARSAPSTARPAASYFKSSKNKTIALIVAGVVAVGAVGGLVALLAGGGDTPVADEPSINSGVLNPTPVGGTTPAPDPGSTPTPQPDPAPPTPAPTASGDAVTIGSGVQVTVPTGWEVSGQSETWVALDNGDGGYVFVLTGAVDPSTDAVSVLSEALPGVLPPENYTQLWFSESRVLEPNGSVVSIAGIEYEALWTDSQGSLPLRGRILAAIRQDGTALIVAGEQSPPEEFEAALPRLGEVISPTLRAFAGVA